MKKIIKNFNHLLGILLVILGVSLYAYPMANEHYMKYITSEFIHSYSEKLNHDNLKKEKDARYILVKNYNQSIFESHQEELRDVWSYEQVPTNLYCFEDNLFGYIEIPVMDVRMVLYIGSDHDTLKKGAAILSQTSIPIGGKNMNCVIAAHRGYQGIPFFREIEKLKVGDKVFITNPWETLTYIVRKTEIIAPNDYEKVLIQPGKDIITLLTCHPYAAHGKQRYVVYCERKGTGNPVMISSQIEETDITKGDSSFSSIHKIEEEKIIRKIAGGFIFLLFLLHFFLTIKAKGTRK